MKIALLGGSFDPPHKDHLLIAEHMLKFGGVDEVWLLPNYGHYYFGKKPHKKTAPVADRLAMARLLETDHIKISTIEIDHQTSGQTIELLPLLPKGNEYFFLIGSDNVKRFKEWHGYKTLLEAMRFIVIPRLGYPCKKMKLYPRMKLIARYELLPLSDLSSTKIRQLIKDGKSIHGLVDPRVEHYIYSHELYKEGAHHHKEHEPY